MALFAPQTFHRKCQRCDRSHGCACDASSSCLRACDESEKNENEFGKSCFFSWRRRLRCRRFFPRRNWKNQMRVQTSFNRCRTAFGCYAMLQFFPAVFDNIFFFAAAVRFSRFVTFRFMHCVRSLTPVAFRVNQAFFAMHTFFSFFTWKKKTETAANVFFRAILRAKQEFGIGDSFMAFSVRKIVCPRVMCFWWLFSIFIFYFYFCQKSNETIFQ